MKNKLIFLLIVIGIVVGLRVSLNYRSGYDYVNVISKGLFDSEQAFRVFLNSLQQSSIDHKLNTFGDVLYRTEDESRVNAFLNDALLIGKPGVIYSDEGIREQFINLLKQEQIPYKTKIFPAKNYPAIMWDQEYDERAQAVKEKLHKEVGLK